MGAKWVLTSQLWPLLSPHLPASIIEAQGARGWDPHSVLVSGQPWPLPKTLPQQSQICQEKKKAQSPPVRRQQLQSQAGKLDALHNSFFKVTTGCGGICLQFQHLDGSCRRMKSEVSLGFIARTCLKGK